jgi:hypothetical protein
MQPLHRVWWLYVSSGANMFSCAALSSAEALDSALTLSEPHGIVEGGTVPRAQIALSDSFKFGRG